MTYNLRVVLYRFAVKVSPSPVFNPKDREREVDG